MSDDSELVICECGEVIGQEIEVGGAPMIRMSGATLWSAHGMCRKCGKEFHWTVSYKMMKRILDRAGASRPGEMSQA